MQVPLIRIFRLLSIVLMLTAVPVAAVAEDPAGGDEMLLFQDIPSVVGASKYEQKVTEAPSSVSIITATEIRKYGYRTLADILRATQSFFVTYDRNYSYVGVRGFGRPGDYNARLLLMIDGHRSNENIYDSALIGTEGILDVDLIDRIEIIRGPGSSLYGSNAFFGVVNVITKRGRDYRTVEVSAEAGRWETYKGRLTYGNRYSGGTEVLASASGYDSAGQRLYYPEYASINNGYADDADTDRSGSAFSKITVGDVTVAAAYSSRTKRIPTGSFGTDFNDPANRTNDSRGYVDVKYERSLSPRNDFTARVFGDYYSYWGDYLYSGVVNRDEAYGGWWGAEFRLVSRFAERHRLIVGAEYTGNVRQGQKNFDEDGVPTVYLDDARRSWIAAAYVQDEIAVAKKVILNAGVRYDYYDTFQGTVNPRAALVITPGAKNSVKLLYGKAFRSPNVYELYYNTPSSVPQVISNPDLQPEIIKTSEVIFEQFVGDHFRGSIAGYYYRIDDLISQTDDLAGNTVYVNETVRAKGVEVELENRWANGFEGRISFAAQRADNATTGEPLTNSPHQTGKANVIVPLVRNRLFAGIEEQYLSRRRTEAGTTVPAHGVTNVTIFGREFVQGLELSASLYNAFDRRFGDPVTLDFVQQSIEQDGRSYRVKVTYRF